MIKDSIKNAKYYYGLSPRIEQALKYLEANNLKDVPSGKYVIDGDDIFMNVQEYETKISDNIESHRKYIDIQFMITGAERFGFCALGDLKPTCEYSEETDLVFYEGKCDFCEAEEGDFLIFFPQDAHLPCQQINEPQKVKKVIIKIAV